jgi:hypothetical protein
MLEHRICLAGDGIEADSKLGILISVLDPVPSHYEESKGRRYLDRYMMVIGIS